MSVFNRIAGTKGEKIPIWPLMTNFSRVVDGEINMQTLAELHSLDAPEVIELTTYLQALSTKITMLATALLASGVDASSAAEVAKSVVTSRTFPLLLRIEHGTITEEQFKAKLGIQ